MDGRDDSGCAGRVFFNEVLVPRPARVLQGTVDVPLRPLLQVIHFRVGDGVREFAHVLLQRSIHQLEAAGQKF